MKLFSSIIIFSFLLPFFSFASYGDTSTWVSKIYWGDGKDRLEAYLDFPEDVARDEGGTFYIADTLNNIIRKISVSGKVSTVFGTGSYGSAMNELASPAGVALDADNLVYVADKENNRILRIDDSSATVLASSLNKPEGVEIKGSEVYFLDTGNGSLKKVSKNGGSVSTITNGLSSPKKMEIIGNTAYVANAGTYQIISVNLVSGKKTVLAGNGEEGYKEGDCPKARFQNLWGITSDGRENLYVSDGDGTTDVIRKIDLVSCATSLLASDINMTSINYPAGLQYADGNIYVANSGIGTIHRFSVFDPNDNEIYVGAERFQNDNARHLLGRPVEMVKRGDWIYFIENNKVKKIHVQNKTLRLIAGHSVDNYAENKGTKARFSSPGGIVVTKDAKTAYIADRWNHRIRGIDLETNTTFYLTGAGLTNGDGEEDNGYAEGESCLDEFEEDISGCAYFDQPVGLALSPDEQYLYVADAGNHVIRRVVRKTGKTTLLAGDPQTLGFQDGVGKKARFHTPWSLAFNKKGTVLYVADRDNHAIRKIRLSDTKVITLAGNGSSGYADGIFSSARFSLPNNIEYRDRKLYVAEVGGERIRLLDLALGVTKLVSGSGERGFKNGSRIEAEWNIPYGMLATKKKLYVADHRNDLIRVIDVNGEAPFTDSVPELSSISPNALRKQDYASGSAMISMSGKNFRYGAEVYFGTYKATKTYVQSATSLAVEVPLSSLPSGIYTVIVQNSDTQSDALVNAFVVSP